MRFGKVFKELTAAGTVRDFHPVPFWFYSFKIKTPVTLQMYIIFLKQHFFIF